MQHKISTSLQDIELLMKLLISNKRGEIPSHFHNHYDDLIINVSSQKCDQLKVDLKKKTATYHAIQRELIERILLAYSINFDIYFLINYLS